MNEGIELSVYAPDATTFLGNVPRRWAPTFLEEHNRDGGGSFRIMANDPVLVDTPTLLNEGNLIKHTVDGGTTFWWEIARKKNVLVEEGEYAGLWSEVSGPGIRSWGTHAVVYPEYGLVTSPGDRAFNFATKQGSWYVAADWKAPTVKDDVKAGGANWAGLAEWPLNVTAKWIWNSSLTNAPSGDAYIRHEFTLGSAKKVKIFASADDIAAILIDGARVLSITEYGAWKKVYTAELDLSAGNHVFAARVKNIGVAKAGLAYAVMDVSSDPADDDALTNSMRIISSGTGGAINAYPATAPGWNVGQIVNQLLDEAAGRGVATLGSLTRTFTNSVDSNGVPWPRAYDMVFSLGDSYSNVFTQLSDAYVDVWISGKSINMALTRGVDRSVAIGSKDPVIFRAGLSVAGASTESTAEIANVAVVNTNGGLVERVGPAGSLAQFGRRESFLSAVNASESGTAGVLIDQLFAKYAMPRRTPTLDIYPRAGSMPWVDFGVGDWILAPSDDPNSTALIKRRIVSLSVTEDEETGEPVYAAEIDTIQQTSEERIARWLLSVENGTKSGGVSGTSSSGGGATDIERTGVGTGSPPLPSLPSQWNPTNPTGLTATSDLYMDETRVVRGKILASWAHNGKDTTGRTLAATSYEVAYRPTGSTGAWTVVNAYDDKQAVIAPLRIFKDDLTTAESYTVAVRAVGSNGRTSDWSQAVDVVMTKDTTPPTQPYFPAGSVTTWLRTVNVRWNGKLTDAAGTVQNDPPADMDYVRIYQATGTSPGAYSLVGVLRGANDVWSTDKVTAGTTYWYRLTAVDRSGNESPVSAARSVVPVANVDADEIIGAIDAAKTAITNVGATSILDNAILTSKLANNAVTLGKIDTAVQTEIAKGETALGQLVTTNSNLSSLTTTVNGKNTITNSTANASGTAGRVNGDRWQTWDTLAAGGKLLRTYRYNGSAWLQESIDPVYIPQIDVGSGTFGTFSGSRLDVNSVTAREMLISRGANMHVDTEIQDLAWWSTSAGNATASLTGGKMGKGSVLIAQTASQNGSYYASTSSLTEGPKRRARVVEGMAYKVGAWIKTSVAAPVNSIGIYPRWFNDGTGGNTLGSAIRYTVAGVASIVPANTWTWVTGFVTCPAGYNSLTLGLFTEATYSGGTALWSDPSIQPAADANLIVQGSVYAEHVNASSVAGAVGSFLTINVSQLNATSAAINTAVVDKLWSDVVQSRKIGTQMLEVTGQNAVSNGFGEFGNNTNWSDWTWSTQSPSNSGALGSFTIGPGTITKTLANNQAAMPVDGDRWYLLEFWIKASKTGSKTYIEFMENNGINPSPQYAVADQAVTTVWTKYAVPVKTSTGQTTMQIRMFGNHPNGTVTDAIQYIAGIRFREQVSADLVVDGGIVARHITASESMWAAVLGAHKINVLELDANSITSDSGFVGSLRTNILTADVITSVNIHATNGITSKHTITGAKFQTEVTANRGVKYDSTGIGAWNTSGVRTFNVAAATGNVSIIGSFTTGSTASGIVMDDTVWGGRPGIRLNTGTGVQFEPTIYAVDSTVTGSGYDPGTVVLMGSEEVANSSGRTELRLFGKGQGFDLKNAFGPGAGRGISMDVNGDFNLVGRDTTLGGVGWLRITGCARSTHTSRDSFRYGYSATSALAAGIATFTYGAPAPSGMVRPQITINAVAPASAVTRDLSTSGFSAYYSGPANNQTTINYMAIWMES
ncbi:minor tail protein [Arthrobacter phage BeatusComedenti]|uniref:Minor tail protein n=1 Tax=Arthrobacter phage BeatusComedenti TaxID=2656523 RepID=A0A649VWA6_9CAUD|nr:minor tail protein [Arthrobacter phage BeatusComedenti]